MSIGHLHKPPYPTPSTEAWPDSSLPRPPKAAPVLPPHGTPNVASLFHLSVCYTAGYLCLWKSSFLRPISTTKCHLPWFPHTVRLSKAHSTLYLGGWASVACLGHPCALDEGSASVIQHGIPSTAAAHGAPEPWPGCSTPALAASYLQS